jgi:hypothetical protein
MGERTPAELNRLLVERMRKAAEAESDVARAKEWRGASPERHGRILEQVIGLADIIRQSRTLPRHVEPPPVIVADRIRRGP